MTKFSMDYYGSILCMILILMIDALNNVLMHCINCEVKISCYCCDNIRYYTGYPKDLGPSRVIHFTSGHDFADLLNEGFPVVVAFTIRWSGVISCIFLLWSWLRFDWKGKVEKWIDIGITAYYLIMQEQLHRTSWQSIRRSCCWVLSTRKVCACKLLLAMFSC
jgi:hypothetical protein